MRKTVIALAIIGLLINPCTAVSIIPRSKAYWTCVDYSLDFAKNNPDWGCLTIGHSPTFISDTSGYDSHMVNYQMVDNNTMNIHDGLLDYDYTLYNLRDDGDYYHFWVNETPVRYYHFLYDNREEL